MITIKNIIFDLGGVILKENPISILKNFNIDNSTYNELKNFFDDWEDLDLGNESLEEKYNKCNFPSKYNSIYKDYLVNCYKYREINTEVTKLISKLKENNYNVYILTDNNKKITDYYKDIIKDIDGWVVSSDYNTLKRDGKLFDILINKYNLDVKESYFIDDNIDNVIEAEKHGIKSYVFDENNNISDLYKDMREKGINIWN